MAMWLEAPDGANLPRCWAAFIEMMPAPCTPGSEYTLMTPKLYRIIEHTADTGFEVWGTTKEEVFESAARAFFDIMWQIDVQQQNGPKSLEVTGSDLEELLVNFLEEFLYLYDAKGLVCTGIKVESIKENKVCAKAWLQKFNEAGDQELLGVKAVTYHQLFVGRKNDTWTARIFLDI
jgi:SHS2 domain-containing protein